MKQRRGKMQRFCHLCDITNERSQTNMEASSVRMKQRCSVPLDHADLAELYQQYAPKIFNYVQKHVSSFQDAEDILIALQ